MNRIQAMMRGDSKTHPKIFEISDFVNTGVRI